MKGTFSVKFNNDFSISTTGKSINVKVVFSQYDFSMFLTNVGNTAQYFLPNLKFYDFWLFKNVEQLN